MVKSRGANGPLRPSLVRGCSVYAGPQCCPDPRSTAPSGEFGPPSRMRLVPVWELAAAAAPNHAALAAGRSTTAVRQSPSTGRQSPPCARILGRVHGGSSRPSARSQGQREDADQATTGAVCNRTGSSRAPPAAQAAERLPQRPRAIPAAVRPRSAASRPFAARGTAYRAATPT